MKDFIDILRKYEEEDIIITNHARKQALFRGINIEEIKENIINPKLLKFVKKQEALKPNEEKFDCYFGYSKTKCHRHILVLNKKCIFCTVIKINRRWQRIIK